MTKFVAAGVPAGVVVCVLLSAASAAWAQENPPQSSTTDTIQSADETVAEPADTTPLPKVVVSTPKAKKAGSKKVGSNPQGGGGSTNATEQDAESETADVQTPIDGVLLGGSAVSDTGTTVFNGANVRMRTDGSGDANTFLRNLPNVQYQNDVDADPGATLQDTIDTRPLLLSINGARTYENNFVLNGVSINSITGPVERADAAIDDDRTVPNLDVLYGLHPQTVYVPTEFIGTATVIDSNASAEYGQFLGGVVLYDLAKPPTDRYRASVNYSRETDDMVRYILGTENGTNPLDRKAPTFVKDNLAVSLGAPITSDLSFIGQVSRRSAETRRQKDYEYFDKWVGEESDNTFMRFASTLKTSIGQFTFDTSHTNYIQDWESPGWRDLKMDVETQSSSTQIEYIGALRGLSNSAIGLGGVTLKSRVYYNDSETGNYTGQHEGFAWVGSRQSKINGTWVETFRSHEFDDWCRIVPSSAAADTASSNHTTCYEGGYGDNEQEQTDYGVQAQLRGNIFLGNFLIGGEAKTYEARRARLEDYTYYSSFTPALTTPANPATGFFVCPPGDDLCTREQYNRIKIVMSAYDTTATVDALHGYAELDQTLGWVNVRAGVRVDYEDYFKNVNIAPRLTSTITPLPGLSFSGGFNRYYIGEALYYALRDGQPRALTYSRNHNSATGVVNPTYSDPTYTQFDYNSEDLDTPYTDEYAASVRVRDPLLGGQWRFRYLERYGEDLYGATKCGTYCKELTNEGESFYRSATAEYAKFWTGLSNPLQLSAAGLSANITWSEQSISRATFMDEDDDLVYILYNGQSYSKQGFREVTGNLDIPVRVGATFSTSWLNDRIFLSASAGYNFAYDGVYDTDREVDFKGPDFDGPHVIYEDKTFKPTLMLDLDGQIAITEQAAIEFHVSNILNSSGNAVATERNPWLRGRSYWVGSIVKF